MILYSIVIPIYNEAENIVPLFEEIEWVMSAYKGRWECIFINDGSTDSSSSILKKLCAIKPYVQAISFKKNYGQSNALAAGIRASSGTWIITLDGDGQNDPRDIPLLIETAANCPECDLVSGSRQKRKDPFYKRLISFAANKVRAKVLHDKTQDTGCSLKMMRASCFSKIPIFCGMHRFLPALFQMEGFITKEVLVHHRQRVRGKSKYHLFNRSVKPIIDLLAVAWMRKRKISYEIDSAL